MDKYDPQKRVGLMVDEWGTWYDPAPGKDMGALYQQNTLRDGMVAAINLNIFNNHSDRVQMANIAQMVNVLQAMILTDKERMLRTPTYHVFRMYRVHQGATLLPVDITAPQYASNGSGMSQSKPLPSLTASASRDKDNKLHLSLVNLDPNHSVEISATVAGAEMKKITGEVLTAAAMDSMNTFDKPDSIQPSSFTAFKLDGSHVIITMPSKSVVVLELQ
jgi:alpha-N-arabinofuranosidase